METRPQSASSRESAHKRDTGPATSGWVRLEQLTALVLVAVVVCVGWMVTAAYEPTWFRLFSLDAEIILVVAVLSTALILVSAAALVNTRSREK